MEQTAGATDHPGSDRRTWLLGAIAIAVLVTISMVAVVLVGDRDDAAYGPGSPEAVVQDYAEAWAAGDTDAAWKMLTPRVQARVQEFEFRQAASWDDQMPTRVWVEQRNDLPDWVTLTLAVEWTWDGLFGPDRDIQNLRVKLVELDGTWRIDTPLVGFNPW